MIEVEQLTKSFGVRTAVDGIRFHVEPGEIVGFLGPNGAGKTTALRMITGFLAPTSGRARVDGIDVVSDPVRARSRIGYMPEGVPLHPELRVREYMRFRARLKRVPRREVKSSVERALEQAGVADAADRIIGQLSKGYRQRVGLADALVADPPILILDEPTSGLDPNQIRQFRDLVRGFEGKKTVLVSTHILPEVEATCGRVIIINRGKIAGEGATQTLRDELGGGQLVLLEGRAAAAGSHRSAAEIRQRFEEVLRGIEGVDGILSFEEPEPGVARVRLRTEGTPLVLERIFEAVAADGLVLRHLQREGARLEDVFAHLTTEDVIAGALDEGDSPARSTEPAAESEGGDAEEDEDGDDEAEAGDDEAEDEAEPDDDDGDSDGDGDDADEPEAER